MIGQINIQVFLASTQRVLFIFLLQTPIKWSHPMASDDDDSSSFAYSPTSPRRELAKPISPRSMDKTGTLVILLFYILLLLMFCFSLARFFFQSKIFWITCMF